MKKNKNKFLSLANCYKCPIVVELRHGVYMTSSEEHHVCTLQWLALLIALCSLSCSFFNKNNILKTVNLMKILLKEVYNFTKMSSTGHQTPQSPKYRYFTITHESFQEIHLRKHLKKIQQDKYIIYEKSSRGQNTLLDIIIRRKFTKKLSKTY